MTDTPHVDPHLPDTTYHAHPALSSSGAKLLLPPSCPAKYRWARDNPQPSNDVFDLGTATHTLVLGAGKPLHPVQADTWNTKAAREERDQARAAGSVPLLAKDMARAEAMAAAVRSDRWAHRLLSGGRPEVSAFWTDQTTGVRCRARFDHLPAPRTGRRVLIGDLKTAASAEPTEFAKAVARYGYDVQNAWYEEAALASDLAPSGVGFVFVVVENTPPHVVQTYQLDGWTVSRAADRCAEARRVFADCATAGVWPGYDEPLTTLTMPRWH
jgi:hypothetical protein